MNTFCRDVFAHRYEHALSTFLNAHVFACKNVSACIYLDSFYKFLLTFIVFRYDNYNLSRNVNKLNESIKQDTFAEKIAIGIVVCYIENNTGPRDEAEVLIRSAILSAKTYKVIKTLEIYIFVEHLQNDSLYFSRILEEFCQPLEILRVQFHFKSAMNDIPPIYQNEIISGHSFDKFRCAKLRLFFPSVLPHLDSILYLDTDIIITGNLAEIWSFLKIMNTNQLIGLANDYEDHSPRESDWISKIPIPPPKGLNSGVLLMNLTKMREIDWESKLMRINKDYSKIADDLNDQQLINILLYFNSQLFVRLPCYFNFRAPHCDEDSRCYGAVDNGVQVVHGAASHFSKSGALREFYLTYKNFDFKNCTTTNVLALVQEKYQIKNETKPEISKKRQSSCIGVLDRLIFKNIQNLLTN